MTILIVDDDPGIRQLLTVFLEHKGYSAIGAANGLEALKYLQQTATRPQLILLDMMMPVMDGVEFRHVQQQDQQLAAIPVAMMSAAEHIQAQASALAADAYFAKPIDFEALLAIVEHYCGRSRQQGV